MPPSSPFHAKRDREVREAFAKLRHDQLEPWAMFNSGHQLHITNSMGKSISYQGGVFDGTVTDIYWSHFHIPCLEDLVVRQLEMTERLSREEQFFEETALDETATVLRAETRAYLNRMAIIDRNLRARGFPERVALRPIDVEVTKLDQLLDQHLYDARRRLLRSKPPWLRTNQWWIQLLIAGAASIPGWIALYRIAHGASF